MGSRMDLPIFKGQDWPVPTFSGRAFLFLRRAEGSGAGLRAKMSRTVPRRFEPPAIGGFFDEARLAARLPFAGTP